VAVVLLLSAKQRPRLLAAQAVMASPHPLQVHPLLVLAVAAEEPTLELLADPVVLVVLAAEARAVVPMVVQLPHQ